MYIKKIEIKNIRSIDNFEMEFDNPVGWHVLIGNNGSGKSSIIKSIALALIGPQEALGLRADWRDWLRKGAEEGEINLYIEGDPYNDKSKGIPISENEFGESSKPLKTVIIKDALYLKKNNENVILSSNQIPASPQEPNPVNWRGNKGWFSVAYGPYRRFAGGNPEWSKVYFSQPKLGAHLSAFGEDVALTEATEWLVKLKYQYLERISNSSGQGRSNLNVIDDIKTLINSPDFLPHNTELHDISSEGVFFKDGNEQLIDINQLSDGYRSILSLTFELIRQLVRVYGIDSVLRNIRKGGKENMNIDLPGVVLIDEIDAHLHPTWQTKIGQWFTKYFPNIQFIVTTHSILVCRASEKGSIWRLAAPGSGVDSFKVIGKDHDRLIFGNVLDAYGTEMFGENVSISDEANDKLNRLAELSIKSVKGEITESEQEEFQNLKMIFPTDK